MRNSTRIAVTTSGLAWGLLTPQAGRLWYQLRTLGPSRSFGRSHMSRSLKRGDHVEWNSEAGRVRGTIRKKVTSAITFKGYTVRASKAEPQYLIKSDKTDHLAMHKGSALKKIRKR